MTSSPGTFSADAQHPAVTAKQNKPAPEAGGTAAVAFVTQLSHSIPITLQFNIHCIVYQVSVPFFFFFFNVLSPPAVSQ